MTPLTLAEATLDFAKNIGALTARLNTLETTTRTDAPQLTKEPTYA